MDKKEEKKDAAKYPGVAIDIADDEKVSAQAEKERTEVLDSNPRSEE